MAKWIVKRVGIGFAGFSSKTGKVGKMPRWGGIK
jgi:hypothetical protein